MFLSVSGHNFAPDLFKSYFIKSSHIYSTRRNGLDILIPEARTESGAQAFNNLPPHLKEVDFTVIFKTWLNDIIFLSILVNLLAFFRVLINVVI